MSTIPLQTFSSQQDCNKDAIIHATKSLIYFPYRNYCHFSFQYALRLLLTSPGIFSQLLCFSTGVIYNVEGDIKITQLGFLLLLYGAREVHPKNVFPL